MLNLRSLVCVSCCVVFCGGVLQGSAAVDLDELASNIKRSEDKVRGLISREHSGNTRVLVVGITGAGKSALVHSIAGRDLVVREVVRTGSSGAYREWNIDTPLGSEGESKAHLLPGFTIGHGTDSGTTMPGFWADPVNRLVFLDCPGFLDSRGGAQDVVNAFSVDQLLAPPCQIRILLALQQSEIEDGARGQEAASRLEKLCGLLPDMAQLTQSLCLVVTKKRGSLSTGDLLGRVSGKHRLFDFLARNPERVFSFPYPEEREDAYRLFTDRERLIEHLRDQRPGWRPVENPEHRVALDGAALEFVTNVRGRFGSASGLIKNFVAGLRLEYAGKDKVLLQKWRDFAVDLRGLTPSVIDTPSCLVEEIRRRLPSGQYDEVLSQIAASQSYVVFVLNVLCREGDIPRMSQMLTPCLEEMQRELDLLIQNKELQERGQREREDFEFRLRTELKRADEEAERRMQEVKEGSERATKRHEQDLKVFQERMRKEREEAAQKSKDEREKIEQTLAELERKREQERLVADRDIKREREEAEKKIKKEREDASRKISEEMQRFEEKIKKGKEDADRNLQEQRRGADRVLEEMATQREQDLGRLVRGQEERERREREEGEVRRKRDATRAIASAMVDLFM